MKDLTAMLPDPCALAELEQIAVRAAVRAAAVVRARPHQWEVETKTSHTDPVTQQDIATEKAIVEWLASVRPHDGVYGEELGSEAGATEITWVIDPIDGTVNYLYGLPQVGVSIAAVVGDPSRHGAWRPVAGAVADVWHDEVSSAALGRGAHVASFTGTTVGPPLRLSVTHQPRLSHALIGTGFSYSARVRAAQAGVLTDVLPQVRDVRRGGSAALDLVAVARGRLDGFYESCLRPWDVAAGWMIVEEAGGRVHGTGSHAPTEALTVAAGDALNSSLSALVESSYARWEVVAAVQESLPAAFNSK